MLIRRSTLRADGLTVGQAMDRDAAFLRSIGIPAKDGALTFDEKEEKRLQDREEFCDAFGRRILDAMDAAVGGGDDGDPKIHGWKDQDLSLFLHAIHAHAGNLFDKGLTLVEE